MLWWDLQTPGHVCVHPCECEHSPGSKSTPRSSLALRLGLPELGRARLDPLGAAADAQGPSPCLPISGREMENFG